jgi:hypothetical protein
LDVSLDAFQNRPSCPPLCSSLLREKYFEIIYYNLKQSVIYKIRWPVGWLLLM